MSIFNKLITLFRGGAHEAGAAVVDANALRILDQEIRDADGALGRARDDLATLVARRRMVEKEVQGLKDQSARYESSARAALTKGDEALAREVAQRISELETEIGTKTRSSAEIHIAEERMHQTITSGDHRRAAYCSHHPRSRPRHHTGTVENLGQRRQVLRQDVTNSGDQPRVSGRR